MDSGTRTSVPDQIDGDHDARQPEDVYCIRPMVESDTDACARMQMRLVPGTVINMAGLAFVRDVYFHHIVESVNCIAHVIECSGKIVGFHAITSDYAAFQSSMIKRCVWRAAGLLALRLLRAPKDAINFVLFALKGRPDVHSPALAEGLALAVEEEHRGGGVALRMLRKGYDGLDTVYDGLVKVQCFEGDNPVHAVYRLLGFKAPQTYEFMGRGYTAFIRKCGARPPAGPGS